VRARDMLAEAFRRNVGTGAGEDQP
jgi:hypothetical protein